MVNLHEGRLQGQCEKAMAIKTGYGSAEELIGRKQEWNLNREIVFRKRRSSRGLNVFRPAPKREEAQRATDLRIAKCRRFGLGKSAKFAGATFDGASGDLMGK